MRWSDLKPDPRLLAALDAADAGGRRSDALVAPAASPKVQWSNRFADACARMIADEMRRHRVFRKLTVLPDREGSNEPPTFVAGDKKKKVDVVASSIVSGLQVGISLKGMNFRDQSALNFDKNLTGRTYELQDEVRVIHGYQAAAFLVAVYFMPIGATVDKRGSRSVSSFGRVIEHLRGRTGRLDPTLASQLDRADMAAVALYVPGDEERFEHGSSPEGVFEYRDVLPRGVIRYFDVLEDPPRRGRPQIGATLDLEGLVDLVVQRYEGGGTNVRIEWAEPERDT